jgi:hypothetical protein
MEALLLLRKPIRRLPGNPLDLHDFLIENKVATFQMQVDGE